MKEKLQFKNSITLLAMVTAILLVTSPAVAVPSDASFIGTDAYSTTPNVELGSVVTGIDQAVYASIFTFGGVDGTSIPLDTSDSAFQDADSWFVASIAQSGFSTYLQQAPSPVAAPDGLSLHISYTSSSMSNTEATNAAINAATEVGTEYSVSMDLVSVDLSANSFVFWANNSDTSTVETDVATDVTNLGSAGLSTLLDVSTITSAPVFWSGYGARSLASADVVQFGAGWVDADGLQDIGSNSDGDTIYQLSSANIFGGSVSPNTATSQALSRVTFRANYPINPIQNGISPITSNPLPHSTGIAEWDLRHPVAWYGIGAQSDLKMAFTLKDDDGFPNVQNKFSINQTKLASDGVLEGTFDLTNIGNEVAEDIEVNMPLGPDWGKIINENRSILNIRDGFELDTSYSSDFNFQMDIASLGESIDEKFLSYAGWYQNASTGSVVHWNDSISTLVLFDQTIQTSLGSSDVTIRIESTNGFPQFVIDEVEEKVIPAIESATIDNLSDLQSVIADSLPGAIESALNTTKNTFYEEQPIFTADFGDFELNNQTVSVSSDATEQYYFLSASVSQLGTSGANSSTSLTFKIRDIPVEQNTFQFIDLDYNMFTAQSSSGNIEIDLPNATVVSSAENWFDVMQYLFERNEFDGRLLSYGYEGELSFGLDALDLDSYHSSNYFSSGGFVTYNNTEDYRFFSFSNGQNMQLADNEAIISATVELDSSVYNPGQNKSATVTLENLGDIAAENVKVHLYEASLGRNWRFDRREKVTTIDAGTIMSGESNAQSFSHSWEANGFVGFSPVFAYVEFDSDVNESATQLKDYLDLGITEYQATGQTHHVTLSTMTGALLLPAPGDVDLKPTLKEPNVEISKTTGTPDADGEFDVTYTLENTGEADTVLTFFQLYETADLELLSSSDDEDATKYERTFDDYGYVYYSGINLDVGDTKTITFTFKLLGDSATIYPAYASFRIAGESTLGDTVDTGTTSTVGSSSLLDLAAGSQAQQDSQKSANEDSSSSSYSASSSVGAAVETDDTGDAPQTVEGIGFVGYDALGFLALMAVPLTLVSFFKRRR